MRGLERQRAGSQAKWAAHRARELGKKRERGGTPSQPSSLSPPSSLEVRPLWRGATLAAGTSRGGRRRGRAATATAAVP